MPAWVFLAAMKLAGTATQEENIYIAMGKLHIQPGQLFLDIGCGSGAVSRAAAARYTDRIYGINQRRGSTARPSDAVHIVLGILRKVVIDHMGDAFDMDPAAGNIGCDEDRQFAVLEVRQQPEPLLLHDVARDRGGLPPVAVQTLDDHFRGPPRVHEDQRPFRRFLLQDAEQERYLFVLAHVVQDLLDPLHGDAFPE